MTRFCNCTTTPRSTRCCTTLHKCALRRKPGAYGESARISRAVQKNLVPNTSVTAQGLDNLLGSTCAFPSLSVFKKTHPSLKSDGTILLRCEFRGFSRADANNNNHGMSALLMKKVVAVARVHVRVAETKNFIDNSDGALLAGQQSVTPCGAQQGRRGVLAHKVPASSTALLRGQVVCYYARLLMLRRGSMMSRGAALVALCEQADQLRRPRETAMLLRGMPWVMAEIPAGHRKHAVLTSERVLAMGRKAANDALAVASAVEVPPAVSFLCGSFRPPGLLQQKTETGKSEEQTRSVWPREARSSKNKEKNLHCCMSSSSADKEQGHTWLVHVPDVIPGDAVLGKLELDLPSQITHNPNRILTKQTHEQYPDPASAS